MNVRLRQWRSRIAVGGTAAVVLAICGIVLSWLWLDYREAAGAMARIEPRYARLRGMVEAEPRMLALQADLEKRIAALAMPANVEASRAGADLQQRVRELSEKSGLGVVASQILPARDEDGVEWVGASLTLEGGVGKIQELLLALRKERPVVLIESLTIQPDSRRISSGEAQALLATLEIGQLRVAR